MYIVFTVPNARDSNRCSTVVWIATPNPEQALQTVRSIQDDERERHYISSIIVVDLQPGMKYNPEEYWQPVDIKPFGKPYALVSHPIGDGVWREKATAKFSALMSIPEEGKRAQQFSVPA